MLLLFETAAGYALFKVQDEGKLSELTENPAVMPDATSLVTLQDFKHFANTTEGLEACTALVESKLPRGLRHFLKKAIVKKGLAESETLAVYDAKVGGLIKEKLGINCTSGQQVTELMRCVRGKISELLEGSVLKEHSAQDLATSALGLAHSYSRYKLKFSPEKVDTMIVQAVSLLDDLDKEINTYCMRVREWYGWHFPELGKVVPDNVTYCKVVQHMGVREHIPESDLSEFVPEPMEKEIKELSQVSMGTDISAEDMDNIAELCGQVIDLSAYREQLWDYLRSRMAAIAPNLSTLVGELVGARLIAHTGSLITLAKYPASTIQILGAEKALFRALKVKNKKTPKYGLIYHASLIGQAPVKGKGKIARVLAAKAALCARVDALADATMTVKKTAAAEGDDEEHMDQEEAPEEEEEEVSTEVGMEGRAKVEARIRTLEAAVARGAAGGAKRPASAGKPQRYNNRADGRFARDGNQQGYNAGNDSTVRGPASKRGRY